MWHFFFRYLSALPLLSPFFKNVFLIEKTQSHTVSSSPFGAPPQRLTHLPGLVHHGLSNAGKDINNESWSRNHIAEHKREREGSHRPQLALLQVSFFDAALISVWWVHMGRHGFIRMCLYSMYGVYAQPTDSFFFFFALLWRGIFLWQAASEKAIKNSQTVHHNGRYHLCNVCSMSLTVFVWNWLTIFNLRTTESTYRQTTNWMKGRGMSGHCNCPLWSSNSSVLP